MILFDILFMPGTILGAVIGTAVFGGIAYAIQTLWPDAYSVTLGTLLVGGGLVAGAVIGSRKDRRLYDDTKNADK